MTYAVEFTPLCMKHLKKQSEKNPILSKRIKKKVEEIRENPHHYKPLKYDLSGECRVHILGSYVLRFRIDEARKTVVFLVFKHHDEAYER